MVSGLSMRLGLEIMVSFKYNANIREGLFL